MLHAHVVWDLLDEALGNVRHIAQHGIAPEEVEEVLFGSDSETVTSKSSGERLTFGYTSTGRYLGVVWEHVMDDPLTMRPITAFEAPQPRKKRR